jgi:hypothetical protein
MRPLVADVVINGPTLHGGASLSTGPMAAKLCRLLLPQAATQFPTIDNSPPGRKISPAKIF